MRPCAAACWQIYNNFQRCGGGGRFREFPREREREKEGELRPIVISGSRRGGT